MSRLFEVENFAGIVKYRALQVSGVLYTKVERREERVVEEWRLHGGVNSAEYEAPDTEGREEGVEVVDGGYVGKGSLEGRRFDSIRDIAILRPDPVVGDRLVVSPSVPRRGFSRDSVVILSGRVKSVAEHGEVTNIADLL